jgi:hypothetical protein
VRLSLLLRIRSLLGGVKSPLMLLMAVRGLNALLLLLLRGMGVGNNPEVVGSAPHVAMCIG